ncbi:AAA family ATPase, partial [Streptomyces sp. ADI96-02]|uniref:AAA family ATPase n=1 Tax=Streptomyces sp. ADI96-02 TaxID=1522760 RepID=UPI0013DE45A2
MNAAIGENAERPLQFFPVAIGQYVDHPPLDTKTEVAGIAELLAPFGAETRDWEVEEIDRGADAVEKRLREWTEPRMAWDTILYWTGHGESDGDQRALLAHALSPRPLTTSSITPQQLVSHLTAREAHRKGRDGWAIVIIDACKSARFVELMSADVNRDPAGARNFLLVATSGNGTANLGTFRKVLSTVLTVTFRADDSIDLWHLATELRRNLGGCPVEVKTDPGRAMLHRRVPVLTQTPLDQLAEIEAVLDKLPDDERRHFVPKARGAELGEQAWYFEGRQEERHQILTWLDTVHRGLLVITGAAGSGKSALLGHVLVHTQPELRQVLEAAGQLTPLPATSPQPCDPFHTVVHLAGATPQDLVARIARAAGLEAPPADEELDAQSDWLIKGMRERGQMFTLLVDALDEAYSPLATADRILRRLAALPMTRVIVGTRRSLHEGPDLAQPDDQYLLDALGAAEDTATVVRVGRDSDAMTRYVRRRLTAYARHGVLPAEQWQIDHAADAMGALDREFLYARLAVHEIIQAGSLDDLEILLDSDHRQLFRRAVERLAASAPSNRPLLEALGLAQGRGLPVHDGIWAATAAALHDETGGLPPSDADIEALTRTAAPYLMLDTESGQSVYRLAHRTFAEHFTRPSAHDHRHHLITERLSAQADAHLPESAPNAYLVQHLATHAALGGPTAWEALARHTRVLDHLDPSAVAAEALRTAYGHADLPPPVAATLGAHHLLSQVPPEDRCAVRALATARLTGELPPRAPRSPWAVRWTHLPATHLHITLSGHTGTVRALAAVQLADGRTFLASAGADRMVRLWDPTTGRPVGEPFAAHPQEIHALVAVPMPDGGTLLATTGRDPVVRLWDPAVPGRLVGEVSTEHAGAVHALAVTRWANGPALLATVGEDR